MLLVVLLSRLSECYVMLPRFVLYNEFAMVPFWYLDPRHSETKHVPGEELNHCATKVYPIKNGRVGLLV